MSKYVKDLKAKIKKLEALRAKAEKSDISYEHNHDKLVNIDRELNEAYDDLRDNESDDDGERNVFHMPNGEEWHN